MKHHECKEGVVVSHSETGAHGLILRGGYRPRVRWYTSGRIVRTEESLLRYVAGDEVTHRKSQIKKERLGAMYLRNHEVLVLLGHLEDDLEGYTAQEWANYDRHEAIEEIIDRLKKALHS